LKLILPIEHSDLSRFSRVSVKVANLSTGGLLVGMRLLHGTKAERGVTSGESFSGGREELCPDGPRELRFPLESFGYYGFPKGWSDVRQIELTFSRERTYQGPKEFTIEMIDLEGEAREVPQGPRLTQEGLTSLLTTVFPKPVPAWLPPYVPGNPVLSIPPPHSFPRGSAEDALSGRIMGQTLGRPIPWTANPLGEQEWTHFLNRHHFMRVLVQAYVETGDERYASGLDAMVSSWIQQNSVPLESNGGAGPAWETLSAAWRLREWLWIAGIAWPGPLFRPSTRMAMLCSIWEHARHLMDHRGHPNNWIIVESAALTLSGLCFPQFKEANRWVETGLERLVSEFHRQFFKDGAHFEISPLYHSICLDAFLEVKEAAAANDKELPPEFDEPLASCASYLAALCRPDFTWPSLNDSNGVAADYTPIMGRAGRIFHRADFQWIGSHGRIGKPPEERSKAFPDAGIAVMRSVYGRTANFLVFRSGPSGAAHCHGDSLSLDVTALGALRVVDPGITRYAPGPLTDYYRSALSHTTILIDGKGPERIGVEFHDRIRPAGRDFSWTVDGPLEIVTGVCRGPWGREGAKFTAFRTVIFVRRDYWIVRDVIRGTDFHEISACWQFTPGKVGLDENSLAISIVDERGSGLRLRPIYSLTPLLMGEVRGEGRPDKRKQPEYSQQQYISGVIRVDLASGSMNPPRGWVSLDGADVPAVHCAYRISGQLPLTAIWLLTPFSKLSGPGIETNRLDREDGGVSLEIEFPGLHTDVIVLGPPPEDAIARAKEPLHGSVKFTTTNFR